MILKHFCVKYDITESNIAVTISKYPDSSISKAMINRGRGRKCIDEKYLTRRYEFRRRIWLKSHELYYLFMEHISERKLSIYLAKVYENKIQDWIQFFQQRLFSLSSVESMLNTNINIFLWKFYRFATHFIAIADRRYDMKKRRCNNGNY